MHRQMSLMEKVDNIAKFQQTNHSVTWRKSCLQVQIWLEIVPLVGTNPDIGHIMKYFSNNILTLVMVVAMCEDN